MYHEGERAVQQRAGVEALARRVGRIIGSEIPHDAARFLAAREFVIAATVSEKGIRASLLTGTKGFARATAPDAMRLEPTGGNVSRVVGDLASRPDLGLLAIDLLTRRRMRVNGIAAVDGDAIELRTREVYGNCPQYIRPEETPLLGAASSDDSSSSLTPQTQEWIARSERFFIATAHRDAGADASHRGGAQGFVNASESEVAWSDYAGNNMFNTLGNLAVDPRCGLLFVDFGARRTLQIDGVAAIEWSGTERSVRVKVTRADVTQLA